MKVFEDYFSELQSDIVSVCLEYVENRAEKIYILCSHEDGVISNSWFYKLNNTIVHKHKLNEVIGEGERQFDVSVDRQRAVLKIIQQDIKEISNLCKKYSREVPTQIKLVYDIQQNKLSADIRYDLIYSDKKDKAWLDVFEEWYKEECDSNI